jgi:hypothetical protein
MFLHQENFFMLKIVFPKNCFLKKCLPPSFWLKKIKLFFKHLKNYTQILGMPIDQHVSVYHSGRSDEVVQHREPEVVKHAEPEGESLVGRLTGLFKREKGAHLDDFPRTEIYDGALESTHRAQEIEGSPLDTHVSVYHSGRSDELPVKEEPAPKEPSSDPFARLAGLFKKGTAHENYPRTEIYEGPLATTSRYYDIDGHPIEHHVSLYHSGRSDEAMPPKEIEVKHIEPEKEGGESFVGKLTGLFKRPSEQHPSEYPISGVYSGPLDTTHRAFEVESVPLDQHVSIYHSGRSDEIPTKEELIHKEPTAKEGAFDRLAGLFKKGDSLHDFPVSEPYEGPYASTSRIYDVEGNLGLFCKAVCERVKSRTKFKMNKI